MSIVVRMEMPNGCHDCKLRNIVGNCPIPVFDGQDEEKIWTLAECFQRPPWCPIICSLPKEHGRLVDADALLEQHKPSIFTTVTDFTEGQRSVVANIKNAPTIVPASH